MIDSDQQPMIGIGIVSCERGAITQECIESIREHTALPYHIYISDNASEDPATRNFLSIWETATDITLIRMAANLGPAAGRNSILDIALGKYAYYAMLDNDIRVLQGWDVAAVSALEAGFDVVQPKLLSGDCTRVDRGPTRAWPEAFLANPQYLARGADRHAPEVSSRQDNATFGGTAVLNARVYETVGGYDNDLWIAEDHDLSYRTSQAGFRICYEPTCEMIHDHRWDPAYDLKRIDPFKLVRSHVVLWQKHERLLLPPSQLLFYRYILRHGIPAVNVSANSRFSLGSLAARIHRRIAKRYFARYGEVWHSKDEGRSLTETVASTLLEEPS